VGRSFSPVCGFRWSAIALPGAGAGLARVRWFHGCEVFLTLERTRAGERKLNPRLAPWNFPLTATRMNPPHPLLDALNDSITSGAFIDTKFYVFSRREVSGHVGSPRALYCNSRILDTVPYFSTCE